MTFDPPCSLFRKIVSFGNIHPFRCLIFLAALAPSALGAPKWQPVDPADLAATDSATTPGADAEIIFSRHKLDSTSAATWTDNHIRAKIFTAKGVEQTGIFSIDHEKNFKVEDVAARVVKSDGRTLELSKKDFRESSVAKKGGFEVQRISFVFPGLEPGDVIEYSWDQAIPDGYSSFIELLCQAEVPTREYQLQINDARTDYNVMWFNLPNAVHDKKNQTISIRNLPPWVEEPLMPPEAEFRGWIMILFSHPFLRYYKNDSAWDPIGAYWAESFRLETVPSSAIRAKAAELIAGAVTPEEKLERLYTFTQANIRNLSWADADSVVADKKRRDKDEGFQTPQKTLERGSGYPLDINRFFAGLARAAGFEVRSANSADVERIHNIKTPRGWVFIDREEVAVKVGDRWTFHTPGSLLIPAGIVGIKDAGAMAFIADEKKSWFETIPIAPPEKTQSQRIGRFTLDDEGNLDGEVELRMTGLRAVHERTRWWNDSVDTIARGVRERLAERLPTAEISDLRVENQTDNTRPFIIRHKVHVPAYATTIGSRLAFTPNFFAANSAELLTAETRRYPVFFSFAEEERDDIQIILPDGYMLDGASAPRPVGQPGNIIHAGYTIKYRGKARTLDYQREYVFGAQAAIQFQESSYPALKQVFGKLHRSDTHQLMLKPKPAAAEQPAASPDPATGTPPQT